MDAPADGLPAYDLGCEDSEEGMDEREAEKERHAHGCRVGGSLPIASEAVQDFGGMLFDDRHVLPVLELERYQPAITLTLHVDRRVGGLACCVEDVDCGLAPVVPGIRA